MTYLSLTCRPNKIMWLATESHILLALSDPEVGQDLLAWVSLSLL